MKKLLIIAGIISGFSVQAQQTSSTLPTKTLSVEESRSSSGTHVTTYQNGKPYTQWAAEENAKQSNLNQQKPVATQNATAQKPVVNNYPAYKPENTTPVALKPTVVSTEAAAPVAQNKIEVQIITTDDVKALNASQKQVPTTKTEMAKPTATPYADKTIPGTLVPLPNSSLIANEAPAVQSTETPVNTYKMPEVKLTEEAKKVESTVPATKKGGN